MNKEINQDLSSYYIKMFRWNSFNNLYKLEYQVTNPEHLFCFIAA